MTFSLLTEPWIPLISVDGERREASLSEVLLEPERWLGIDSIIPVEVFGLYRLMVAIGHRAIGPESEPRTDLVDHWPRAKLAAYLERWSDHFDLLHPTTPFLQVSVLAEANLTPSPWTRLAMERSSGAARMIWDHSMDATPSPLTFSAAARLLVAHLQFTPGGLVKALRTSAVRGPACGVLLTIPIGGTLQETLAFSIVPQFREDFAADLPSWERPPLSLEELRNPQVVLNGPAHRYTLLSRSILLQPSGGQLTHLLYAEGVIATDANTPTADPMAAVVQGKKGPMPLLLSEQKALWRDFQALVGSKGSTPAGTLSHASGIREEQGNERPIEILAGGLLPDQAKIVLWRLEERRLAPNLLREPRLKDAVDKALELAENAGVGLGKALYALFAEWLQRSGDGKPDPQKVRSLGESIQGSAFFWSSLEPEFWSFVHDLSQNGDIERTLDQWRDTLKAVISAAQQQATSSLGLDARALKAASHTSHQFGKVVAGIKT
jgi:CRISPR system Cascade subunit CasA